MNKNFFFSLRYKITLAFFGLGFFLSLGLGVAAYRILEEKLFAELRDTVGNVTRMGAALLDRPSLTYLAERQKAPATPELAEMVENSPAFRTISAQLNFIRDTEKELIRYVYLLAPTSDPGTARFMADADVIALKENDAATQDISHFNAELDLAGFPVLKDALHNAKHIVEPDFVYDETFGVNSVSGYAPVLADDGQTLLALLGLDMADTEVRAALAEVLRKSIAVGGLSLFISLMMAIILGTLLTRGIIRLDQLVRSFAEKDFAVRSDVSSNDEVGRLGSSFNHMAGTIEEYSARLEALLQAYGRFVPHDLLRLLDKKSILDVNLGDQTQREMSVLFSDIRNFTSISETMNAKDNFDFINSYLRQVGPRIRSHSGIIDKYIGDAVMALFPERVEDAIDAALEMQDIVRAYNIQRHDMNFPMIKIGIGIHTGSVTLGTIGEEQRMDGTVISDTVNLASRIEGLTKEYGCAIVISDKVLDRLEQPDKYFIRFVDRVRAVGKTEAVTLYEIFNADDADLVEHKHQTYQDYSTALDRYFSRDFGAAESLFAKVAAANANDIPARIFLNRTRHLIANGIPPGWNGISHYGTKH